MPRFLFRRLKGGVFLLGICASISIEPQKDADTKKRIFYTADLVVIEIMGPLQ